MKHGSLFSGIGGFDYAASIMGWENVFHCEWNTFGQQVLKYHFPNSICHDDITKTDFSIYRGRIDIISGGFPCQPYSMAGRRLGKDDERHLWPEMLRVIREISPKWIVGENVFGIVNWSGGLVFEEVQADLEREGYEVQSYILPAAGVNAPHKRDRVWFVGYAKHNGRFASKVRRDEQESSFKAGENEVREFEGANSVQSSSGITQNSNEDGRGGNEWKSKSCIGQQRNIGSGDNERLSSDNAEAGFVANSHGSRLQAKRSELKATGTEQYGKLVTDASDTDSRRQPGEEHRQEKSEWFTKDGLSDYWQNFPTQSPVCFGNDGISTRLDTTAISFPKWRNESIKAAGNAVVPQVVLQIFKAIQDYENLNFC